MHVCGLKRPRLARCRRYRPPPGYDRYVGDIHGDRDRREEREKEGERKRAAFERGRL